MIWSPLHYLRLVARPPQAQAELATRWRRAFAAEPGLVTDLMTLGRVLEGQPRAFADGVEQPIVLDPHRLAYEAGQRDLAVQLLGLGHVTPTDVRQLMKETQDD